MAETAETNFDELKEKIVYLWQISWKPKAYASCVQYLKVFQNDLYL